MYDSNDNDDENRVTYEHTHTLAAHTTFTAHKSLLNRCVSLNQAIICSSQLDQCVLTLLLLISWRFTFFFSCSDHTVCCIVSGIYCVFLDHLYFFSISSKITSPEMWLFAYSYNFIHIWLRDFVRQLLTWRHLISNNYLRFVGLFYLTRWSEKCDDKTKVWFSLPFMMTKSQYEYTRFTGAL